MEIPKERPRGEDAHDDSLLRLRDTHKKLPALSYFKCLSTLYLQDHIFNHESRLFEHCSYTRTSFITFYYHAIFFESPD
jgi:hypothetical protein